MKSVTSTKKRKLQWHQIQQISDGPGRKWFTAA